MDAIKKDRRQKKRRLPVGFELKLYNLIIASNKTLAQIGRDTGINPSNLTDYYNGVMIPSAYNLFAICKYFNVSADWLLGLKEDKNIERA